jgi:hypothetical protein
MKKLLLSFSIVAGFYSLSFGQNCSPNQIWADTTDYGVIPDTIQNFPPAVQNEFYTSDLNFKVPVDATLASSDAPAGSTIQSFKVNSVQGLPAGLSYVCNNSNCTYNGGANGCANVYGTPTETGVFPVTINITANVIINPLIPTPIPTPTSFSGYKIVVGVAGSVEQFISPITVSPNPANDVINIDGITSSTKANSVSIVNLEGKVIAMKEVTTGTKVSFDLTGVKSGMYFVNVSHASGVETVKFIKE